MTPRTVSRLAWRDWRSGELGLLLAALLVAVGTVTAISLFVDRLHQALRLESASFLAADRYIGGSRPIPEPFRESALARGIEVADAMSFPSMVFGDGDRNQLVSVKAVSDGYPLRGALITGTEPFEPGAVTERIPPPGEVWLDSRLFPALNLALGDEVEVGLARLVVGRVLIKEPDRGGSFFDLGPRLLMNVADVPATEVVQPGSRIRYRLLLRGPDNALEALREELSLEPNYRWMDIRENSPSIGSALDRAESFLLLGGLLGVLLAGVAVALSAHRYAHRHYDHVGILKTLGATPGQVLNAYLGILGLVGAISVVLGLALGTGLHLLIIRALDALLPVSLPMPSPRPFLLGAATGLICALAFAMPPLLHLKNISPLRVMRRDLGTAPLSQWASYGAAGAGGLLLLIWYSDSLLLTLWTLGGILAVTLLFGGLALVLLRGGRAVGMQAGSGLRLALAGLQRRRRESTAQILIFGLAIMLLLVLVLLRTALIDEWRAQLPDDLPNHFLMNVTPDQLPAVESLLSCIGAPGSQPFSDECHPRPASGGGIAAELHRGARIPTAPSRDVVAREQRTGDEAEPRADTNAVLSTRVPHQPYADAGERAHREPLYPMIRGRVVAVNGTDAKTWDERRSHADRPGPGLRSERNLTWTTELPEGNEVVAGRWWSADDPAALVSLEDEYARDLGLKLGDRIEFDIGDQRLEAEVSSLRTLDWETMQPNFFIIFSPAALRDFPATYMTSFHLPAGGKAFLNRLLSEFPTVTVIEIDAIVEQVQRIVDRVTAAVELVLALVIGSGCLVLVASIRAGWDARMAEHALVRTMGGTRKLIAGSLAAEFIALGAFSGVVAVVGAELTVSLLQWQVFELPPAPHPWLWLLGPVVGAALIFAVGMMGARRLVSSPPLMVLRGTD